MLVGASLVRMELNGTEQDEAKTEVEGKTGNIDAAQGRA